MILVSMSRVHCQFDVIVQQFDWTFLILEHRAKYLNLLNQTLFRVQIMYGLGTRLVGNLDIMKITLQQLN